MAIDLSGRDASLEAGRVTVLVGDSHPLILLAKALPWTDFMDLVVEDLKATTAKGSWWMGRKMKVRMHLAAYLLQSLYNLTDRRTEYQIKDNAAFQLFCGIKIVQGWHAPDHSKIEEFRNRLTPETHRILANRMAKAAVDLGFGDPREVDFDSTVQQAHIAYPSDASLMTKLSGMGKKFVDYIRNNFSSILPQGFGVDM